MTFRHSGDLGDIVYSLGVIKLVPGGPHRLCLVDRPFTANLTKRADIIIPLAASQSYIESCVCSEEKVDFDFSSFRPHYRHTHTLLDAHYQHLNMSIPDVKTNRGWEPWLEAKPSKKTASRVIFARSPRYNNDSMKWFTIADKYRDEAMFVGLDAEYDSFCRLFGWVERLDVSDYKQLAEYIAGCSLFIGNQSSPYAIAEGLKVRRIQETSTSNPDCVFRGGDVQHVVNGSCVLHGINGNEDTIIPNHSVSVRDIDTNTVPPGGWQYQPEGDHPKIVSISIGTTVAGAAKHGASMDDVLIQNAKRLPEWFFKYTNCGDLYFVKGSFDSAGIPYNFYPTFTK